MKIEIFLPIKNEGLILNSNLKKLLDYLFLEFKDYDWQVVGVVNNSTDNSLQIVQDYEKRQPIKVKALSISQPGKGRALKTAWRASQADILVFMDADLAVDLEATKHLILPIINQEADLVVGSRFLQDSLAQRSKRRGFLSRSYVIFSNFILNHQQTDIQCGFKAIKKEAFQQIEKYLQDDYWFFDTELVVLARLANLRIKTIPVKWRENRTDRQKSNVKIFQDTFEFIKNVICFKIRLKKIKKYLSKDL
ncbi:MAG: glycosyltransferase [Patescibacteria group bacterium]|jgi:glycosyltransferase involved in cell wall biosynthesis|nr:glycosyltransferase [bacterium]HQC49933.1 glycosyltransferase [bacterium]